MINFSTCQNCGARFENPNVEILLEPAKTQTMARLAQKLIAHTAVAHPDRFGVIQAATLEYNGFLQMMQFTSTDEQFNTSTKNWGAGVVARVQKLLGFKPLHVVARQALDAIASQDQTAIATAVQEFRQILEKEEGAIG